MTKLASRKFWLLLLLLLFTAGALAACSGGDSGEGSGASGSGSADASDPSESSDAEEPLELSMMLSLFEEVPDMENDFWVEFQNRTNTKLNIDWVPDGDYDTKLELILASGDLPDVLWARNVSSPTIQAAISNGAFWELGQFLGDFSEYPNLQEYSSPLGFRYLTQDGKIVGIPRNRPTIDQTLLVRKDWLDKFGMDVPQTMEEYGDYLVKAATEDPDDNGQHDTVGYVHAYGGTGIPTNMSAAFGAFDTHYDDDGGLIHTQLNEGYTKAVEFMQDVYARGGLPQEFATIRPTQAQELFESGKAASYQRNIWRAWMFEQSIRKSDPEAEVVVSAPEGPDGHKAIQKGSGIFGALYISSRVPEEKVLRILDFFEASNTPEFFELIFYGIEGVHYNVDDNGYKVMTEQGNVEIGTSAQQPIPMAFNNWWKAFDKAAPEDYNNKVWEDVQDWDELGHTDPFDYVVSDTWTNTWPNYQNEWENRVVETIVGRLSIEEYRAYVDELNQKPEIKQAYQEFKAYYDAFWAD